jgi:hypothetical protein
MRYTVNTITPKKNSDKNPPKIPCVRAHFFFTVTSMQQCSITLTLTFIERLCRILRSSSTERNSQVGGFGPKFVQN